MGQVSASSTVLIDAEPETVLAKVADYQVVKISLRRHHQRRVGRVLHVAELPGLMGTRPGEARRCWRVGSARPSRRRSTAGCPSRPAGRA